jgi:hypothetical protein
LDLVNYVKNFRKLPKYHVIHALPQIVESPQPVLPTWLDSAAIRRGTLDGSLPFC